MFTRPKVGIAFQNLSASEMVFSAIMTAADIHEKMDVIFFYENAERPCLPIPGATMQFNEIWSFQGPIIATSLSTAQKILSAPSPNPKYFYCYDIEWTRYPQKHYHSLLKLYRNPEIRLISRCEDHRIIIEQCWNNKVEFVAPSFAELLNEKRIITQNPQKISFLTYGSGKELPSRPLY